MSDLLKRLRDGDEFEKVMSAGQAADRIEELEAKLAEVEAERDAFQEAWQKQVDEVLNEHSRAEAAEAMLPRAYRAGVDAGANRASIYLAEAKLPLKQRSEGAEFGIADAIRAVPKATIEQLKEMMKEKAGE